MLLAQQESQFSPQILGMPALPGLLMGGTPSRRACELKWGPHTAQLGA